MTPVARVLALAALVVLTACSPTPGPEPRVATLETAGSAAPSASASRAEAAASRPRERLDMTVDDINVLNEAYLRCLAENGHAKGRATGGDAGSAVAPGPDRDADAEAACLGEKPLPPWEYDTANPESADFVHAVVQCLRDKGVRHVQEEPAVPGDDRRVLSFGGPDNDATSISKGLDLIGVCEKERMNR
ncbi:hypothetical protein ACFV4N_21120 [Actinosynnema sp. NPDC059797]